MATLTVRRPRLQITDISHPWLSWLSGSCLDRTAVAAAIAGTGWSVLYHEAPDFEASLMVVPEDDDRFSTFVISVASSRFCVHECRRDVRYRRGQFDTLEGAITRLRHALADQVGPTAGDVAGQA